jgi:hypothetical protein
MGAALLIINFTDLLRGSPLAPPGTTYHVVKDAGDTLSPTEPETIKATPPVRSP